MKTPSLRSLATTSETSLFDAMLLLVASSVLETQTHGAVKPFGKQRLTLRMIGARLAAAS